MDGTLVFGTIGVNAVPGEAVCGTDYTGEDFHVHQFTLTDPSLVVVHVSTGGQPFGQAMPDGELFVLANCDINSCIPSLSIQTGNNSDPFCLPAGDYTVVVSSPDANGTFVYATAVAVIDVCSPVATEDAGFGQIKSRF